MDQAAMSALAAQLSALKQREALHGRGLAEPEMRNFLAALPADAHALMFVAQHLCLQHRFDLCVDLAERAVRLGEQSSQLRFSLAQVLYQARRPADAIAILQELLVAHPHDATLLNELGLAFVALGDTAAAREALDRAIRAAPRFVAALHQRALIEPVRPGDAVIGKLEELSRDSFGLRPPELVRLWYGLGKVFDDLGEHARAFEAFATGASVFRKYKPFDEAGAIAADQAAERLFRCALPASTMPARFIFIVGMPRSGTTLTEQILLGDALVTSIGETLAFSDSVWFALRESLNTGAEPSSAQMGALARNYALRLNDYGAQDAPIVLDKTPTNFLWAPLAAAIGGRVVHCRRDVLDTCWSLYTTWFGEGTAWSYDFDEIARTYARYERSVARWRADAVLDVSYETLVSAPRETSAALFAHCGLAWRPEVLDFHKRPKTVVTPSMAQVRKPVSASSVRRLAPYLPMLEPLIAALRREGVGTAE